MEKKIRIVIFAIVAAMRQIIEAADNLLWDFQFRMLPEVLAMLAREAEEEDAAGLTDEFDLDGAV